MRRALLLLLLAPLVMAGHADDRKAVKAVLQLMVEGEQLPEGILERQEGYPQFADLDMTIADVKGCKPRPDPAGRGIFGVEWYCKGRKKKEQPSAMLIYTTHGEVTKITTANIVRQNF